MNLREYDVVEPLNAWIGSLFARKNVDRTVAALVASAGTSDQKGTREAAKTRLADAEARLRRFQEAIAAGIDPAAVVDVINDARPNARPPEPNWTEHPHPTNSPTLRSTA